MRGLLLGFLTLLTLAIGVPAPAAAQNTRAESFGPGAVTSPVLTIDSERLFRESAFGQRIAAETEARGNALSAENREIEAALEAEELELTEKRATMAPDAFRALADAFDEKVQQTRTEQASKTRALNERIDAAQEQFLTAAGPVLEQLMREAGAAVILDVRAVFASVSAIEITDAAIARLDETLGTGADQD